MNDIENSINQLKDIRTMMERSSRFISLSGWSGISAGSIALIGAAVGNYQINNYYKNYGQSGSQKPGDLFISLCIIAIIVFIVALVLAVFFTYRKSQERQQAFWDSTSKRLLWNTFLPMAIGALFILKLMAVNQYQLVAPACLLFYGLGLINGSKYTLGEVRYLGYAELILGLLNLIFPTHSLLFWAIGFGIMHIVYGIVMWWTYDRKVNDL